jgi:hypothetical protein
VSKRRFHAMDRWLRSIESWSRTAEMGLRLGITPALIAKCFRAFPAYPEGVA